MPLGPHLVTAARDVELDPLGVSQAEHGGDRPIGHQHRDTIDPVLRLVHHFADRRGPAMGTGRPYTEVHHDVRRRSLLGHRGSR